MAKLHAPQMVTNSRMLYFTWIPADPDGVAALVPDGLTPAGDRQLFINQYVVDSADQTSGFDAYSLTYMGVDLEGLDTPDGAVPGRWWTHYYNSNADMREYAAERGVPVGVGETTLEQDGDRLVATTSAGGRPIIRTQVRLGGPSVVGRGQLRYVTDVDGTLTSGLYPFVADMVDPFEVLSFEFLEPDHESWIMRPADPLQVTWGFYSPAASFCYPGGEGPIG